MNQPEKKDARLSIYGRTFQLRDVPNSALNEVFDTFAGAVSNTEPAGPPDLTIHFADTPAVAARFSAVKARPRHRGGSGARKFFLNGMCFDAACSARDIVPLYEEKFAACYRDGETLICVTRDQVVFMGMPLPEMLLSDVIENWLLSDAKSRGELMVHGAGWLREGRVYLVTGSSGAGKTTQLFSEIKQGAGFFCNDRAFLRMRDGLLEARSFPMPVNIGCGTIRSLEMDLPHYGFPNNFKMRLTPREVLERFPVDYDKWLPVESIYCVDVDELEANLYWGEDECHPFWNRVFRPDFDFPRRRELEPLIRRHLELCQTGDHGRVTIGDVLQQLERASIRP